MAGASIHGAMLAISATIIFHILVATGVASKETCTTVQVSGGNYTGDFEQGDGSSTYAKAGTTYVIQAISFGDGARARRRLAEIDGVRSVGRWRGGGQRGLADDCESQMWILADTAAVDDGYPYYAAFDCADHPAEVESTWVYIDCDDCAKVAPISITCVLGAEANLDSDESDGDNDSGVDSFFTLPVIIGIAAAGLVVLFCVVFFVMCRKKKAPTGSQTFADESEHGASLKGPRVMGTSAPPDASFSHVEGSHEGPSVGGETATSPAGLYPSAPQHQKNLSKSSDVADNAYGGIYASGISGGQASRHDSRSASSRQPSRADSLVDSRKDSMAEAAAAAHAARAKAMGIELVPQEKQQHLPGVLRTGGYERRPLGDGSGVKWSAGQNLEPRGIYDDGVASQFSDSAAGSVFSIHPPPDDMMQEHAYDCDESVAASSPGAYSMYSHFTVGGGTYGGGMSEFAASDVDDLAPLEQPRVMLVRRQDPRGQPPSYESPPVALDSPDSRPPRSKHVIETNLSMSPAGLAARADQNSARRNRKAGKRADKLAEDATR